MKKKDKCNCVWCKDYQDYPSTPKKIKKKIKNEEMNFLKSVGVKVKKVKTFEDALRMALR